MHEEAFYLAPEFWVAVTFLTFLALVLRPLSRTIAAALDKRALGIASELGEARRLREEASALLAAYRERQQSALAEAQHILDETRRDAEHFRRDSEANLRTALDKRLALAEQSIQSAEARALHRVTDHLIDIAIDAAKTLIARDISVAEQQALVQHVSQDITRLIH